MSFSKNVGLRTGRAAGWTAATAVTLGGRAFTGLGELGEGLMEGAEAGYADRIAAMEAADEIKALKAQVRKAELLAARQEALAAPAPVPAKARRAKAVA